MTRSERARQMLVAVKNNDTEMWAGLGVPDLTFDKARDVAREMGFIHD